MRVPILHKLICKLHRILVKIQMGFFMELVLIPNFHKRAKNLRIAKAILKKEQEKMWLKDREEDFPGGTVDKNLPTTCRGHAFAPWPKKTLQALEQPSSVPQLLSLNTTTTEDCAPKACALQQEKPPQ